MSQGYTKLTAQRLKEHFNLRKQYSEGLLLMLMALMQAQTNNLKAASTVAKSYVKVESVYKRFCRLLNITLCPVKIGQFIAQYLLPKSGKFILTMDRTYWVFGKTHLNFLYLGIVCYGMAIPIFFKLCGPNKKGHSSIKERNELLDQFKYVFGKNCIQYIVADREFMGCEWTKYLQKENIPFVIRFKENGIYMSNARGSMIKASHLCHALKPGETQIFGLRKVGKVKPFYTHMAALKTPRGEIVLVGYCEGIEDPLSVYQYRWTIEICFRSLKSQGFNMEDTSVTDPKRLITLMRIMLIASSFVIKAGLIAHHIKPIPLKKHGYKDLTFLKYGLNLVVRFLSVRFVKVLDLKHILSTMKIPITLPFHTLESLSFFKLVQ